MLLKMRNRIEEKTYSNSWKARLASAFLTKGTGAAETNAAKREKRKAINVKRAIVEIGEWKS